MQSQERKFSEEDGEDQRSGSGREIVQILQRRMLEDAQCAPASCEEIPQSKS
jgi:hypothetical protein